MTAFFLHASWLIPLYPMIGALLTIPWAPGLTTKTGPRPTGYIAIAMTLVAFIHSAIALIGIWGQPPQFIAVSWLSVADLSLIIPIDLSTLSLVAALVITGLNILSQIYAVGYLEMDWGWGRFFALMALFEGGMCALVLCDSLFFSYILLEILTLGTYLLVGFWYNQSLVVTGARDAFLTKRVGDLVLLMAVLAIYPLAGTWDFHELAQWSQTAAVDPTVITLLGLGLIAGPMSKCAQFPVRLCLDEAMEGPLPSFILRNAVVVAVGAWVLVKLEPVISLSPVAATSCGAIGAVTAVGATLVAIAQVDIKRVLSYLSSAYMGLVFVAVGGHQPQAALLLVMTYAFAMALLMMGAGSIILSVITQDLTQMGGLWSRRPVTGFSLIGAGIAFVGLPPLGGFWALLKLITGLWEAHKLFSVVVVAVTSALAALAIARMLGLIFAGEFKEMTGRAPEPIWIMVVPMTVGLGFCLHLPIILAALGLLPALATLNLAMAGLITGTSAVGGGLGVWLYCIKGTTSPSNLLPKALQDLLAYDFYTPSLYRNTVVAGVGKISQITDWLDRYVIDGLVIVVGLASLMSGGSLKYGNSGRAQTYVLTIAIGVVAIALYVNWQDLISLFNF
ncbi:MAG: NAD(P)H-quinone oxidoreductase subunit F [Cyanophyceae cyanobacterium]